MMWAWRRSPSARRSIVGVGGPSPQRTDGVVALVIGEEKEDVRAGTLAHGCSWFPLADGPHPRPQPAIMATDGATRVPARTRAAGSPHCSEFAERRTGAQGGVARGGGSPTPVEPWEGALVNCKNCAVPLDVLPGQDYAQTIADEHAPTDPSRSRRCSMRRRTGSAPSPGALVRGQIARWRVSFAGAAAGCSSPRTTCRHSSPTNAPAPTGPPDPVQPINPSHLGRQVDCPKCGRRMDTPLLRPGQFVRQLRPVRPHLAGLWRAARGGQRGGRDRRPDAALAPWSSWPRRGGRLAQSAPRQRSQPQHAIRQPAALAARAMLWRAQLCGGAP